MADRKISQLTALTTPASGDFLPIVDISEAANADKNKRITLTELFKIPDAVDIATGTGTGTKIGTSVSQKLSLWNAAPIVQPASANQAALGAATTVGLNTGTSGAGLSLIGNTTTVDQATALMNDLKALQEDIAAAYTLINQLRTDLVAAGIIKGAA